MGENDLLTPLLPHISDDDPAAAAHAVGQGRIPLRQSSTISAAKRRRRRSSLRRTFRRSVSRQESSAASTASDEITRKVSNLAEEGDSGSEHTDYGEDATKDQGLSDVPIEKMTPGAMARSAAVVLAVGGGIVAYSTALIFASTVAAASATAMTVLGVAGGVCVLTTPLVLRSEWRLAKLPTLRGQVNSLRHDAKRLQRQLDLLVVEEKFLREESKECEEINGRLERLVKEENAGNVDAVLDLVHQNQITLRQMKESLRQMVMQDVIKLVLRCDVDHGNFLSKREAQVLEARLSASLEIHGISFDAEKFYRAVGLNPSIYGVMTIVKRLLPDENDRMSSFYDDYSDSDDEDIDAEEEDDVYDMYYVPVKDGFKRGNRDTIRLANDYLQRTGERPCLMSLSASMRKGHRAFRQSVMKSSSDISDIAG